MEKKSDSGELDLSISKSRIKGKGKNSCKSNETDHNDVSITSGSGSLMKPMVSLDPPTLIPHRSSISSLLSLNHLRLWENPITASAISAAAAMTHLMDINNAALSSAIGKSGKSTEDHGHKQPVNRNMCMICGRVARNQCELERHMLTHSMEKPYQCVKCDKTFKNLRNQQSHQFLFHNITDGLTTNRMHGLLMSQKKRKKNDDEEPLDVTMNQSKKQKNVDQSYLQSQGWPMSSFGDHSNSEHKSLSAINSMNSTAFPCTSCHKTFSTEVDLKAHMMRHFTQHPFVCLACGKGFKYEHSLNFHIKSYHGVNDNKNNNNNNNNSASSSTNIESERKGKKLKSENGESEGKSSMVEASSVSENTHGTEPTEGTSDYDDEETSIDEDIGDFDDDTDDDDRESRNINFDYGAPANLAPRSIQIKSEKVLITLLEGIHPVTEQTYILYKCCLCGFAFPSLEPVTLHLQNSHLNNNKDFTCEKCGATFKWRSELQLHEQLHKAMDQQEKCGQFTIPSFLQQNLFFPHQDFDTSQLSPSQNIINNNNNNSPIIGKDNGDDNDLSINFEDERIFKDKRKKKVRSRNDKELILKQSTNSPHEEVASDSTAKGDDFNMPTHVAFPQKFPTAIGDIEETAPGQFKCRFCDKTFDRIFSVHRHERVHTGFKPCICKTCGRGFSEKRNLRHHIIRFHSDGSGRELLKRNRKDKGNVNNSNNNKQKIATSLKKAALKILNSNGSETLEKNNNCNNNRKQQNELKNEDNNSTNGTLCDASTMCSSSTVVNNCNIPSSSSRRRKGKPSKKVITAEVLSPLSSAYTEEEDNNENLDEDLPESSDKYHDEKEDEEEEEEEEEVEEGEEEAHDVELNPCDFLETKFRCHGAFFSSYNPRLGVVEKPVKRNEACRPMLGPDGKYLYPCSYCNKTFCSLSDLNRHMNFHEDVRPFKCEYCNYQSRTNSQLKVHMMRHAGIKQFLCQVCNYNGVTQSDLNRHCKTRSHSLRSANICPLCALGFSTRTLLEDHILKFHETLDSTSSTSSSEKSNVNNNNDNNSNSKSELSSKTSPERNNNDYSFPTKKFSVNQILN